MSAIATFTRISRKALPELKDAAIPKKVGWFKPPRDDFGPYLERHAERAAEYPWSGYILATLLVYLEEEAGIRLMDSGEEALAEYLREKRDGTWFVLEARHREEYLERLEPASFSETALREFYNEFNETDERDAGLWMRDGVATLRTALRQVDEDSVILFHIG